MTGTDLSHAFWRKSSYSQAETSECVEVARVARTVAVRDSKNPDGPVVALSRTQWSGLLAKIKADCLGG